MSLRLRERDKTPPGMFRYTQPESGKTFMAHSFDGLCANIADHRRANNYPMGLHWQVQVEQQLCELLVKEGHGSKVENVESDFVPVSAGLKQHWQTLVRGTRTLFDHLANGKKVVDRTEAERRAAICAGCEFNLQPQDCKSCRSRTIDDAVRAITGGNLTTTKDNALHSCYWCGCFLKAKVHVPLEIIQRYQDETLNTNLPAKCWGKKT